MDVAGFFTYSVHQNGFVDRHQIGADVLVFRILAQKLILAASRVRRLVRGWFLIRCKAAPFGSQIKS